MKKLRLLRSWLGKMNDREEKLKREISSYVGGFFEIIDENPPLSVKTKEPDEVYVNLKSGSEFLSEREEELTKSLSILVRAFLERRLDLKKNVQIDIKGAKLARRESLEEFVLNAAKRAKDEDKKIRLNPMPSLERKWVHVALSDVESVETYSVGEGEDRRVIINPKGK